MSNVTNDRFKASQRSHIRSTAQEFTEEVKKLSLQGKKVISLHVGQPSTGAPSSAIAAAKKAMSNDILGYTSAFGLTELRERIALHYKNKYQIEIDPMRVVVTPGASVAFQMALIGSFDRGANFAVSYPVYPAFLPILRHLGLNIIGFSTRLENRFQPTVEDLEKIDEKIDGLLLIHPGNPSGSTLSEPELKRIVDYCLDRGIRIISDETYHGILYERFLKETTAVQFSPENIVINSFSKYYSMPGWRVGWMIAPDYMAKNIGNIIRNLYICAPVISQHAAIAAMDAHEELDKHVARYAINRNILLSELPKAGFDRFLRPQGAFYFYAHISHLHHDSYTFCLDMLKDTNIAAFPGSDFDPLHGNRYVRFSYAGSTEEMEEAMERLIEWRPNVS